MFLFISEPEHESDGSTFKTDEEINKMKAERKKKHRFGNQHTGKSVPKIESDSSKFKTDEEIKQMKLEKKKKYKTGQNMQKNLEKLEGVEAVFMRNRKGTILKDPIQGFMYMKCNSTGTKSFWRCRWGRQLKCKATAITEGFYLTARGGAPHNHSVSADPRLHISEFSHVTGPSNLKTQEDNDPTWI